MAVLRIQFDEIHETYASKELCEKAETVKALFMGQPMILRRLWERSLVFFTHSIERKKGSPRGDPFFIES